MDRVVAAGEPMASVSKFVPVPGSEKALPAGARLVAPIDPGERIEVTFLLRAAAEAAPPADGTVMSREEYASRFGAAQADMDQVIAFARRAGLSVVAANQPQRTVVVAGPAAKLLAVLRAELGTYEESGRKFRGRSGPVQIPSDLGGVVVGVFGLDDRPVAKGA